MPGLHLTQTELTDYGLTVQLHTTATTAACPRCQPPSSAIHSRYTRTAADLPWGETAVHLVLQVRKFFCRTLHCAQRIFAERLPTVVAPQARKTTRLTEIVRQLAFALGGEAGARICNRLRMPTSPDALLALIRATPTPPAAVPRVLGVDDWALRKGHPYGTILVDLEQHRVVDLLPDRTPDSFATWLAAHPGVEMIARDRGEMYALGGRQGAPTAVHIADRWHLLKNLGETLERLLTRHVSAVRQAARATAPAEDPVDLTGSMPTLPRQPRARKPPVPVAHREWQRAIHQQIRALAAQGWSSAAIARARHLNKITVYKYRRMDTFVDRRLLARPSVVEPYRAYVDQRWAEGGVDAMQVWLELQTQGFTGSYKSVWWFTRGWPTPTSPIRTVARPVRPQHVAYTPRQVRWLLLRRSEHHDAAATAYCDALRQVCPAVATAYPLVQAFLQVVRERHGAALDGWLGEAEHCGVPELRRFARGIRQEYAAIRAALDEPWSSGQVEGQVHRLKLVKRAMYGRANFDLLRQRVLHRMN